MEIRKEMWKTIVCTCLLSPVALAQVAQIDELSPTKENKNSAYTSNQKVVIKSEDVDVFLEQQREALEQTNDARDQHLDESQTEERVLYIDLPERTHQQVQNTGQQFIFQTSAQSSTSDSDSTQKTYAAESELVRVRRSQIEALRQSIAREKAQQ